MSAAVLPFRSDPDWHNAAARPRIGFLGVGWIGRHRLNAVAESGLAEIAVIADAAPEAIAPASEIAPQAVVVHSFDELLSARPDAVVIATPSALHAEQAIEVLSRGMHVFCQKPLGRNADETRRVIEAARRADRLLAVDLSYRFITGMRRIYDLVHRGELGRIFAVNLVFHNAYGPDKAWFYDRRLSGGGCVTDLGIHLIDLALWTLDFPRVQTISSHLFAQGEPLQSQDDRVEDYATALLALAGGATVQMACSWKLQAGCDAVIEASFYGTQGGARLHNINGSFYDLVAERFHGTTRERLSSVPDEWGGRAITNWARRVAAGEKYNPSVERLLDVAETLDGIYAQAGSNLNDAAESGFEELLTGEDG